MKNLLPLIFLVLLCSLNAKAEINILYPRNLDIQNKEMFQAPPQMSVNNIANWIKGLQRLKHIGFENLGDYTDAMHGHVLFRLKSDVADTTIDNLAYLPFESERWNDYEAVAVLFHTQEYGFLRNGDGYNGKFGSLDILARNWILLLQDGAYGKAGDIIDANLVSSLAQEQRRRVYTVFANKLIPSFYNTDFSVQNYSFYFYKVSCDEVNLDKIILTNVIEVNDDGERSCLLVQSEKCHSRSCGNYRTLKHITKYFSE